MKNFVLAIALLTSSSVIANNNNDNNCDIKLTADVEISPTQITFLQDNIPLYRINHDQVLLISDNAISLNERQQALLTEYAQNIRAMVPAIKTLAFEGVELTQYGIGLAFNKLLGENSNVNNSLNKELHLLKQNIAQRLASDQTILIKQDGSIDGFNSEAFEQHIEVAIEQAVEETLGSLMMAVGQKLIFSGGNMEKFEQDMEAFAAIIEDKIENQAEALAIKAGAICLSANQLNILETQLSHQIPALKNFNILVI